MGSTDATPSPLISGIAHVNLLVPAGTFSQAEAFYSGTLGFVRRPVPALQKTTLAWFDIGESRQQVHIAFGVNEEKSSRHPCFRVSGPEALLALRQRVWEHFERGDESAPREADTPGAVNSGSQGAEYPQRFFCRDYANNRLEFSL